MKTIAHNLLLFAALALPALCAALPNGPQRQRNLAAFRSIADSYERAGGCGLPGFLRHLEGLRERGMVEEVTTAMERRRQAHG